MRTQGYLPKPQTSKTPKPKGYYSVRPKSMMVDDRLVAAMATDFGKAVVALLRHFLGSVKGSLWSSGSLLDAILHFCSNKPVVRIRNDHFYYGPNREPVLLGVDGCRIQDSRFQDSGFVGLRVFGGCSDLGSVGGF